MATEAAICLGVPDTILLHRGAHIWVPGVLDRRCDDCGSTRASRLLGLAFKRCWVTSNCIHNAVNALALRHLVQFAYPITELPGEPYLYRPSVYEELKRDFHACYREGAWRTGKSLRRQAVIQDSLDWDEPREDRANSHIKTSIEVQVPTKSRLIQAFHRPADNYALADLHRAYTDAFVRWTSVPRTFGDMYVHVRSACGLNHQHIAEQITEWVRELANQQYRIFMDDVTNMDGSIQEAHFRPHLDLYQALDPRLARELRAGLRYKGFIRTRQGVVNYMAYCTVRSGAQDTSSGQTSRRLDMFVRACRSLGVRQVRAFVFGDDIIAFLVGGPSDPKLYDAQHALMGLKCRACFVEELEQADFLSCAFVPDVAGGYAMLPKLGRLLAKLFWTWRDIPPRRLGSYLHQVAEAFLPRFQSFELMAVWLSRHMHRQDRPWTGDAVRIQAPHPHLLDWPTFLSKRYSLPLPVELTAFLGTLPPGTIGIIEHPWSRAVLEYDLADPGAR